MALNWTIVNEDGEQTMARTNYNMCGHMNILYRFINFVLLFQVHNTIWYNWFIFMADECVYL